MSKKTMESGLFYTRDSGGRHETTPAEYVKWAKKQAKERGVNFEGSPAAITRMIEKGLSVDGDIYLDYDVSGNILSRDGLNEMIKRAIGDKNVTHVFIPRRDRLARPDDPVDGVQLEKLLRSNGITLCYMDKVLPPLAKGKRQDIGEMITAIVDFNQSGEDRRQLAQKIIYAQIQLAKNGFSIGGRAPYGFRRWLAKDDGTPVRLLKDGERVRMQGHHVVWLPGPENELEVIRRILKMLETMPATQVAATLTAEEIPSPNAGRTRTDNGVEHEVSGVWHQTTVINIARNPLLLALTKAGIRSMGDQLRFTPNGPRELEEGDYRLDRRNQEKPKIVRNQDDDCITAQAKFEPLVDPQRHKDLLGKLDERGGTQRGKPRSRDPARNPLGARIYDMNCGWPMYRVPYKDGFRYKCGFYQQSHGQRCAHNHVDGTTASEFVLSCIRQKLMPPDVLPKLRQRLEQLAAVSDSTPTGLTSQIATQKARLHKTEKDIETVARNMALADSYDKLGAMANVFDELQQQQRALTAEIEELEKQGAKESDISSQIETLMAIAEQVTALAHDRHLEKASELFGLVDAKLFLRFEPVKVKKRTLNKVLGGKVTFGDQPPPIDLYKGPTSRQKVKEPDTLNTSGEGECDSPTSKSTTGSGEEGKSLGNVSRGDWI